VNPLGKTHCSHSCKRLGGNCKSSVASSCCCPASVSLGNHAAWCSGKFTGCVCCSSELLKSSLFNGVYECQEAKEPASERGEPYGRRAISCYCCCLLLLLLLLLLLIHQSSGPADQCAEVKSLSTIVLLNTNDRCARFRRTGTTSEPILAALVTNCTG
jgi:hypothetical protein